MTEVNLFEIRSSVREALKPVFSEVARFKDDATAEKIVADSQRFVIYSLKNLAHLRVLVKSEVPAFQVAYKTHTAPVRVAKFVSDLSNIAASASQREINVWYIDQDIPAAGSDKKTYSIYTYFTANIDVVSFSWVPLRDRPPNVLVLFRNPGTEECSAGILKSSDLIVRSSPADPLTKVAKQPDGSLVASFPDDFTTLAQSLPATARHTGAANPTLAFSYDATTMVTCTLANPTTPKWKPCNGETIVDVAVLPTETLVAAGESSIFLWDVAGEPRPLQVLKLNGLAPCTFVKPLPWGFVAGFGRRTPSEIALFKLPQRLPASHVSFFALPSTTSLPPAGVCVSDKGEGNALLLGDLGGVVSYATLNAQTGFQSTILSAALVSSRSPRQGPSPVPAAGSSAVPAPRSQQIAAGQHVPPSYAGAVTGGAAPPPYNVTPPLGAQVGRAHVAPAPPAFPVAPFLLSSPAAAQQVVARPPQGAQGVEPLRQALEESISTAQSVLTAAQQMIVSDHEMGVRAGLEATTEIIKKAALDGIVSTSNGPVGSTRNPNIAFDEALSQMFAPMARSLVESVSAGVEEYVSTQLETSIRAAMTKQQKKTKPLPDLRDKVDTIVRDAISGATAELQKKTNAFNSRLMHYIYDLTSESTLAMQELQKLVQEQQKMLDAWSNSGLLEEIDRLRQEVATLKARGAAAAAAPVPVSLTPETVLANAQQLILAGDHDAGLQWVLRLDDDATLHKLFSGLDEDTRDALTSDKKVSANTWTKIVDELTRSPKTETLSTTTSWLTDIIMNRPELMTNAQLEQRVQTFLSSWKAVATLDQESRNSLRQLSVALRR